MTNPIRVGVVGTSWFADLTHLPSLKNHAGAQIAAICGRDRARAEEMAAKYAIPQVFTDYREMIARGELQALLVVTPDDLHYPIVMAALDAGLHVLCEKPLALNAAQTDAMCRRAEAAGVRHMVNFVWRGMPAFCYAQQLIEQGFIGQPYHCAFSFTNDSDPGESYAWRFDRQRANGILGDLGSHMIDMARWMLGDITGVAARLGTFVERPGPDGGLLNPAANDVATLAVEFDSGVQGTIHASGVASGPMLITLAVHGSNGAIEAEFDISTRTVVRGMQRGEQGFRPLPVPDELGGDVDFQGILERLQTDSIAVRLFIDSILAGHSPAPDFHDGHQCQLVIDAALASHAQRRWITVGA